MLLLLLLPQLLLLLLLLLPLRLRLRLRLLLLLLLNAEVPPAALHGIRVARLVALCKPNGRVRALAVGDVLRRLVGRMLSASSRSTSLPTSNGHVCPSSTA